MSVYEASNLRLNYHIGPLIGFSSIMWSGHIIHKAIPVSRGGSNNLSSHIKQLMSGNFSSLSQVVYSDNHVWLSNIGAGTSVLTFNSGLKPDSNSLILTDIAHHHLAIGVLIVIVSHLYSSLYYGYGHHIRSIVSPHGNPATFVLRSSHIQLAFALMSLSFASSLVAQHTYSLAPFAFMSFSTLVSLYVHHQYIASLLMFGGIFHTAIFIVRDYSIPSISVHKHTHNTRQSTIDLKHKVTILR
jgi:photosystem I P700 chlorophyll a apoprotein A2